MDVNGLAERCRQLIESPEVARKMGEQARKRVERDFSATAMADRVASVYKELVMPR
jgi:glycosyltransferase involved in cell wall biosynthesis